MKTPSLDLQSNHILKLAWQTMTLPILTAVGACRGLKAIFWRTRSGKELRADDQARQSRVRRELRGMPDDHVQRPAGKA